MSDDIELVRKIVSLSDEERERIGAAEAKMPLSGKNEDNFGNPGKPMETAKVAMRRLFGQADGQQTLRYWRGDWYRYRGAHWQRWHLDAVKSELYLWLEYAKFLVPAKKDDSDAVDGYVSVDWNPNQATIGNLMDALRAVGYLSEDVEVGDWLAGERQGGAVVSTVNGLVNVETGESSPHTPRLFNHWALPFEYDPEALPRRWLEFLDAIWPGDEESKGLLQEWFGYCLSGRADLQKMMFLKGASRGGKGVIARVLETLMGGTANVAGPTFAEFAGDFGMATFLNRGLAVIGDARSSSKIDMQRLIGNILSVTGQDVLDVNVKHREHRTVTLGTRLMMLSNELPWFKDSSGALNNRLLLLVLTQSWAGREDPTLEPSLHQADELAGIFNWALQGSRRLSENGGRFTEPTASAVVAKQLADEMSPIGAFLREECAIGIGRAHPKQHLWMMWCSWCEEHDHPTGTRKGFINSMQTIYPEIQEGPQRTYEIRGGSKVRDRAYLGIEYTGSRTVVEPH